MDRSRRAIFGCRTLASLRFRWIETLKKCQERLRMRARYDRAVTEMLRSPHVCSVDAGLTSVRWQTDGTGVGLYPADIDAL